MQTKPHSTYIFFQTAERESAEAHVVFHISEECFRFNTAKLVREAGKWLGVRGRGVNAAIKLLFLKVRKEKTAGLSILKP
jgi:hypothetical protein